MSVPVPAPVLDAMREQVVTETGDRRWRGASDEAVALMVEWNHHPDGVSAFLRDHGNEGGEA